MIRVARPLQLVAVIGMLIPLMACEKSRPTEEQRAAIQAVVGSYLNALADAYTTLDTSSLEGLASPNEIAAVRKLLRTLAQTGDRVESTLRVYEIEHLEIFREINATVRLVEVWDVVRYDVTSGEVKGRTSDSIQYSLLQLRLVDGRWIVVGRSVLRRETPVPSPTEEPSV